MDFESERQESLAEARERLTFSNDETLLEKSFGPGSLGYDELFDLASIMVENRESFIAPHPATLLDPELYLKAREIAEAMADFYQIVGSRE